MNSTSGDSTITCVIFAGAQVQLIAVVKQRKNSMETQV